MKSILLFIYLTGLVLVASEKVSYEGYRLYKVIPKTNEEVQSLLEIQKNGPEQFWLDQFEVNDDVRIMVKTENEKQFLERVKESKLETTMIFDNLQT